MEKVEKKFYETIKENGEEKERALAVFMFKEVFEKYCPKYNVSNKDRIAMYNEALCRAKAFLEIYENPELFDKFCERSVDALLWECPSETIVQKLISDCKETPQD